MNRRLVFLCCLWGAAMFPRAGNAIPKPNPAPAPEEPQTATLRWNNGESLGGDTVEATDTSLTWKSPLFEDPLRLAWHALHRIDWPLPNGAPAGPFRFVLRDGSHFYGDLTGMTADTVTIHGERHGDATLRRAEVLRVQRIRGGQLVYAGPLGESGWAPTQAIRFENENTAVSAPVGKISTRWTGPGGMLVLPFWQRTFFLDLPLPERMDVEFRLHSKERPAFQLALDSGAKERLRVETWGDELVLTAANSFEKIRSLGAQEREVALRVCWDRTEHRCQVYTPEGALLKEWKVPAENGGTHAGVLLENKGQEMALDLLRVRVWDGQPPPAADPARPRVELDDGRTLAGTPSRVEAGQVIVPAAGEGPPASFPLDAVDAMVLACDAPADDARETTLSYADGTFLHGQIAGIKDGRAALKTGFTAAPFAAQTGGLRQVFIRAAAPAGTAPEPALKTLDKIVLKDTILHGHLAAAGDAQPRWLPVGGERPATPLKSAPSEITRAVDRDTASAATTLLYTRMGDILPGVLHGLDRTEVEFESPMIETGKLSANEVQAVQFDVATGGALQGFDAPGWQVVKGTVDRKKEGDELKLAADSALGHPAIMQNGEIKFRYDTENFSCLRLRMFCDGVSTSKAMSYIIFRMSNRMSSGVEETEGQFFNQNQTTVQSGPVNVRLVTDDKGVRCYFNDVLAEVLTFPVTKRAGSGLIIEPTSMWGNQVTEVTLSKFSASSEPGQNFFRDVNADAKSQALTIPRFRKEDPPRHALLAANGDLLRGEIDAITKTQFGFRIGLETLRVPRERVKAVIALQPPSAEAPVSEAVSAVSKLLEQRMEQQNWYSTFSELIDVVHRKVSELTFKLPDKKDLRRMQYRFNGESVGDAIDKICDRFQMRYHIEDKTFIFESGAQETKSDLVQKVYWLKANALPKDRSVHDVLAAKGITFPGGAKADWRENARELVMTNTPDNQGRLTDLLNNEFGGVLGSPDYWMQLTNGGRIGLTVDKFEPETISGTHPVYGRCTVPMSEVYSIRNTVPGPTAAGHAMDGWQLVYAPEPVLPESGGEGSALLGKDAPAFKLAILGGGDLELGKEKGHVVVLDFWATWCGPCIKALPGMIETMAQFPADKVKFVGLNQAEVPEQVKRFLETRGWKLTVAMDAGQNVARQYGVDGIPHTVIIGPDGKVAWVRTGYDPDGETQVAEAVKKLLGTGTGTPPEPTKDTTLSNQTRAN